MIVIDCGSIPSPAPLISVTNRAHSALIHKHFVVFHARNAMLEIAIGNPNLPDTRLTRPNPASKIMIRGGVMTPNGESGPRLHDAAPNTGLLTSSRRLKVPASTPAALQTIAALRRVPFGTRCRCELGNRLVFAALRTAGKRPHGIIREERCGKIHSVSPAARSVW